MRLWCLQSIVVPLVGCLIRSRTVCKTITARFVDPGLASVEKVFNTEHGRDALLNLVLEGL